MRAAHLGAQRPHRAGTDHAEAARPCQRVKVKVPLGVGQGHSEGGGGERVSSGSRKDILKRPTAASTRR